MRCCTYPCRRVRNHYSKRILNLILNRKKFFRRGNEGLEKQKTAANAAVLENGGLGVRGQESVRRGSGVGVEF